MIKSPRRHRASARAVVVQRQSLVWPVTASARGGSVPSHAPAHAAPVQPLLWVCRRPPVGCSLCRFASAAAADPSASLQGGLVREAAVGRRRQVLIKDAPPQPRSSSVRRVCSKEGSTSTVVAMRSLKCYPLRGMVTNNPRPCIMAVRPRRKLLRAIRHHAASPKVSRTVSRTAFVASGRSSLPRLRCRASHRAGLVGSPLCWKCSG